MNDNADGIIERWQVDSEMINGGVQVKTKQPQCIQCKYRIAENLMHCERFVDEEKKDFIIYSEKECEFFKPVNELELNIEDEEKRRKLGALFGFVVGDALGVPVEFENREKRDVDKVTGMRAYGTYHQPFGTWSDDTSLMLALIVAFEDGYSISRLADNCVDFYRNGRFTPRNSVFDIGITTVNAIQNIEKGIPLNRCGGSSEYDNGNGSLMRILPMGLIWDCYDDKTIVEMIEEISSLTHAHKQSKFACILYSFFIKKLLSTNSKEQALDETIDYLKNNCREQYATEFETYDRILSKSIIYADKKEIKSSGYVVDSLEAAIWCFMKGECVKDILLSAVNLGDDTDTIAAITGGMAGAFYGVDSIPNRWIQILERKEELAETFNTFIQLTV